MNTIPGVDVPRDSEPTANPRARRFARPAVKTVSVDVACCRCAHWSKWQAAEVERGAKAPSCPRCHSTDTQAHWPSGT